MNPKRYWANVDVTMVTMAVTVPCLVWVALIILVMARESVILEMVPVHAMTQLIRLLTALPVTVDGLVKIVL